MNPFKGRHFQRDIILWAVRWYCKYGISYRELQEMLAERGEIITAFYIARQPLGADTVINPPHGQGDIFTHAWRGGNGVSTQRFR